MKRLLTVLLSLLVVVAVIIPVVAICNISEVSEEEFLLNAAQDVIKAYEEFYDIEDVEISNIHRNYMANGHTEIEYLVTINAVLAFDSATELPQIRGLLGSIGIDGWKITTSELNDIVFSGNVRNSISLAVSNISYSEKGNVTTAASDSVIMNSIIDYTLDEIVEFVNEIEEYIGETSPFYTKIKLDVDGNNEIVGTEYAIFSGYTDDINLVIPASEAEMIERGEQQFNKTVERAMAYSTRPVPDASVQWNSGFVYYRTNASEYANTYTSDASERICDNLACYNYGGLTSQDASQYNPDYSWFCCSDCANFVSQAMYAGGVPTRENDWEPYTNAWVGCIYMREFFLRKTWWSATDFTNCNAGGIIMLCDRYGSPYHVQMCVFNNTVTRKLSSHTRDRKELPYYSTQDFGAFTVEYYRFDNVYPAH